MSRHLTALSAAVTVADGIAHYIDRLRKRGRSENTLRAYGTDLAQFDAYVQRRREGELVALMTRRHTSGWLDTLSAENVARRSQARKLTVLRGFFKHSQSEGWIGHDPTAGERVQYRAKRVIAPEMDALYAMVERIPAKTRADVRDRAMLRLALDAGLRISEVASLDIPGAGSQATIDVQRHLVHVIAKGGDTETVAINERTSRIVADWLRIRGYAANPGELALFVSARGGRFVRQSLHEMVKRRAKAAGIDHLTFHMLRHRRIGDIYSRCGKEAAQAQARHVSGHTTEIVYGAHADTATRAMIRERADLDRGQGRASS